MVVLEYVLGEEIDKPGHTFVIEVRTSVDRREETLQLLRICLLKEIERVIENHLDVVRTGAGADVIPARLLGNAECADGSILVVVVENRPHDLGILCVELVAR